MTAAAFPEDEATRKRVLNALNILDSLPEAFSNAIATAAAAIANVPISAISLVDAERQWFKSSCGLAVAQTPRDVSFCAHAILGTAPFLVPDALEDPRFHDNPLVLGAPYIRAYAGFPLVIAGQRVGALCVIDNRPRQLTQDQIQQLSALAAGTAAWLGERQSLQSSLDHTKEELRYVTLNDRVTGLPTRLVFEDRLAQARATGAAFAVLLVDIDGFTPLQDVRARGYEDDVWREVGERLTTAIGPRCTVASVGNNQFLVLSEDRACAEDAARLADLIAMDLALPFRDDTLCVTASIGIAMCPADVEAGNLVGSSHVAMVAAKQSGGDCYRFFEPSLEVEARDRAALLDDLRLSTRQGELRLHYHRK